MERRFVSQMGIIYFTSYQNYARKRTYGCIQTTDWQFLRIKVDQNQKKNKSNQSIFRENKLKITIQCNLKIVDYLYVTFNLINSYHPFNKTNNEINYILNNQTTLLLSLAVTFICLLRKLSSSEIIFNDPMPIYLAALIKAGYNHKLTYQKHDNLNQCKRQIILLNPHIVKMLPQMQ